jgi:hypothetical protein
MAFDRLSEAEKKEHHAKLQAAMAEDERVKAAKLPKPTLPLRETGLNSDHPLAKERAKQRRVFHNANEQLKTNIASLRDYDSGHYRQIAFENELLTPEEMRELEREKLRDSPPPEPGAYDPAPKPATQFTVVSVRRLSKADRRIGQRLLKLRTGILEAIARNDRPAAGAMLRKVKDEILDHGAFGDWVTREIDISMRSAQRYMEAAKAS